MTDTIVNFADYHATEHRRAESRFTVTFWQTVPCPNGGLLRTLFFKDSVDCNRFVAEVLDDDQHAVVCNLSIPAYHEQFSFNEYGEHVVNLREKFKRKLLHPEKAHLRGKILTREEVDKRIRDGLSVTMHSRGEDDEEVCFFSNNHIFGYTTLPEDFTACSFSSPFQVVPREGLMHGFITNVDEFLFIYGQKVKVLWDIEALLDELNIPEE